MWIFSQNSRNEIAIESQRDVNTFQHRRPPLARHHHETKIRKYFSCTMLHDQKVGQIFTSRTFLDDLSPHFRILSQIWKIAYQSRHRMAGWKDLTVNSFGTKVQVPQLPMCLKIAILSQCILLNPRHACRSIRIAVAAVAFS